MPNDSPVPQSIGLAEMGILRELLIQLVQELRLLNGTAHEILKNVKAMR